MAADLNLIHAAPVKHLVVDSAAFLKRVKIYEIGAKLFTVKEVVAEIRDAKSKQFLHTLPVEVRLREPSAEAIRCILDTGTVVKCVVSLFLFSTCEVPNFVLSTRNHEMPMKSLCRENV